MSVHLGESVRFRRDIRERPGDKVACVGGPRGVRSLLTPAVFVIGPVMCGEPIRTRWGPTLEPCGAAGPPPFLAKGPSGDPNIRAAGPHFNDGFPKSVPHGTGGGHSCFFSRRFARPNNSQVANIKIR